MGYSRSCPRTQAASTRHVSDLTPRSDSRPHQPGLPPKRLSTVGTCSIAAAPCRRNPRQHSTESLFSAQSLPFRSASRSSRKDTGLQPVCPAGSPPLLSPTQQICCLVLPQQTRRQWLPASPSGGSPPPLLSPVQHLCCPVLLRSATATLAASLKSQATKMHGNGSTTLRLVEQKQWKHKRTAVRASPGLLQHRKTIPFAA